MPRRRRRRRRRRVGMENDETAPNLAAHTHHCYHVRGANVLCRKEIRSIDGLKQFGSELSSGIFKDFEIGGIGGSLNSFQRAMRARADDYGDKSPENSPYFLIDERVYGRNKTFDMQERKTFISSDCNHLWLEKLYGITRVAVYGVDSICVVTWNDDFVQLEKDLARLRNSEFEMDESPPHALILEIEDLACPPGESRTIYCKKRSQKPFGVVSVIAGTDEVQKVNGDEASGEKFDELKVIKFLREKLSNTSHLTFHKTVKTAIRAFHHLLNKKFKPNKLRVFVWKSEWENEEYDCDYDETVQELKGNDLLAVYFNDKQYIADSRS